MSIPYYERFEYDFGYDFFLPYYNENIGFPPHMHRYFEIIACVGDGMTVIVDDKAYNLNKYNVIIIKPYQIHEIKGSPSYSGYLFLPDIINAVSDDFINFRLTSPVVTDIGDAFKLFVLDVSTVHLNTIDIARRKGVLYLLCSYFTKNIDYTKKSPKSNGNMLLQRIFDFVEHNTDNPCSMESLAAELDRTPAYLSSFFSTRVGLSYSEYVRKVKMNKASHLLAGTNESVLDIALRCGYDSLPSFNRAFKALIGKSPTEYRREIRKK